VLLDFLQKKERREGLDFLLVQQRPAAPLRTGAERSRRFNEPPSVQRPLRATFQQEVRRGGCRGGEKNSSLLSFLM
jgi:hypothetical protein